MSSEDEQAPDLVDADEELSEEYVDAVNTLAGPILTLALDSGNGNVRGPVENEQDVEERANQNEIPMVADELNRQGEHDLLEEVQKKNKDLEDEVNDVKMEKHKLEKTIIMKDKCIKDHEKLLRSILRSQENNPSLPMEHECSPSDLSDYSVVDGQKYESDNVEDHYQFVELKIDEACKLQPSLPANNPINCPANCGMNVFFKILEELGYKICTRLFLITMYKIVSGDKPVTACTSFMSDLYNRLILVESVFNKSKLTGYEHLQIALYEALEVMEKEAVPGLLLASYTNKIGHYVKITPQTYKKNETPPLFDLQMGRKWPDCDKDRNNIHEITVLKIKQNMAKCFEENLCGHKVCNRIAVQQCRRIREASVTEKPPVGESGDTLP